MVSTFSPIVQYSAEKCSGTVKKKRQFGVFTFYKVIFPNITDF